MLTLYSTPESLYCAKSRILLRHKRARWREVMPPGGCGSAEYRKMIPAGTMPAIVDGDLVLADSEAIAEYLDEALPEPPMLPRDSGARAKCRERSRFHDTRLEPELRKLFPHLGSAGEGSGIVVTQSEVLNQRLLELARLLESDTSRDSAALMLGDCGYPVSFAWLDAFTLPLGLELEWPQEVCDYREQVANHAAVAAELEAYRPAMQAWIESKLG